MTGNLPKGWATVAIDQVFEPRSSRVSPGEFPDLPYVGLEHVEPQSNRLLGTVPAGTMSSSAAQFAAGDVLYGRMRPYLNKVVQPKFDGLASAEFIVLPAAKGIDSKFLLKRLSATDFVEFACSQYEGDRPRVKFDQLGRFQLHVPPTAEQIRIVDKLDELLSDLDAAVAELKAAQKKLAQYRQSLLKAAVEGRLTEAWRAEHGEPEESGAQLLARILRERQARWEAKQLAKFEAQCKAPTKGWQEKYPDPAKADQSGLPSLPSGWVWASADQLTAECSYGTSVKCSYENNGTPVLRIPNVARRALDFDDLKFASEPLHLAASDYLAQGDILVVRTNGSIGLVGRAAAIEAPLQGAFYFASYLLRLRVVERTVVPIWISAFLGSSAGRSWIEKRAASSAGQHNISLSTLLALPIPLPPMREQHEAIAAMRVALEACAVSESDTATALRQSTAQRKNILQAAFSGRLVPQDPNDEPAGVLLARIRAERAAREKEGTSQRKLRRRRSGSPA